MSAPEDSLDKLIRQTQERIERIEQLQKKKLSDLTSGQGVVKHVKTQGNHFFNILMAASCLAIAVGRLNQKNQHQAEKEQWQEAMQRLTEENRRLCEQLDAAGGNQPGKQSGSGWFGGLFGKATGGSSSSDGGSTCASRGAGDAAPVEQGSSKGSDTGDGSARPKMI